MKASPFPARQAQGSSYNTLNPRAGLTPQLGADGTTQCTARGPAELSNVELAVMGPPCRHFSLNEEVSGGEFSRAFPSCVSTARSQTTPHRRAGGSSPSTHSGGAAGRSVLATSIAKRRKANPPVPGLSEEEMGVGLR